MKAWHVTLEGGHFRVAMEKDTLDIWVNGDKVETAGEFTGEISLYIYFRKYFLLTFNMECHFEFVFFPNTNWQLLNICKDSGTETHFELGDHAAFIQAVSSGNRREGIIHTLVVDEREIPETYD
jgi:hypothetical protein